MTMIRQGDVVLRRVSAPQTDDLQRATDGDGRPLAGLRVPGERSSHEHVLPARVYDAPGGRLLFLERPTPMRVLDSETGETALLDDGSPRHADVVADAGWWEPIVQREYVAPRTTRSRSQVD